MILGTFMQIIILIIFIQFGFMNTIITMHLFVHLVIYKISYLACILLYSLFCPGAFLIVYFTAMTFCGIPIFFQEVAIGQYLGSGGMTLVSQLCPMMKGDYWRHAAW